MSAARRLPGTLETKAGRLAGYDPQDPPARLRYAALEKLLTHDLPGEEAEDWRAMLRRAVWQDQINCHHTGILTHEATGERRPLDAAELRRALAGIRYFKGLGPRPDCPPLDSEKPEIPPQNPRNLPFVTVDVDGPFDDIGPTGCGLPIGTLDAAAQVHIQTEFTAASVRDWLHTLTEPNDAPPVLWAWINATTPRPTRIGFDELACIGFPTTAPNYEPYILKQDGLYAVAPDAPGGLSYAERRALHPPGTDYGAPVLGIPCGIPEFVKFLDAAGLWEAVDHPNQAYAPAWAALGLPTPDAIAALLAKSKDAHALAEALPGKTLLCKKSALIAHLETFMRERDKLSGLLSNASKNGLNACRTPGGWDLGAVARWLLLRGYLKPEVSEKHIESIILKVFDNS